LTLPAEPGSYISKQLTRVFARQRLCNAATSEATCKGLQQQQQQQQGLGCYWNGQRCDAKERSDWSWFSRCVLRSLQQCCQHQQGDAVYMSLTMGL
jgi:hypothetical protein